MQQDPSVNQGGKILVETLAGLDPEQAADLIRRCEAGQFTVAIETVATDVEDRDRNVVTEPNRHYQVISSGIDYYLIQTS